MGAKIPDPERYRAAAAKLQRQRLLIFSRYCQVMFRFEHGAVPRSEPGLEPALVGSGREVSGSQAARGRNEPDYAAKIHIVTTPVYYHNYMLGEMFASQVHHALIRARSARASSRPCR